MNLCLVLESEHFRERGNSLSKKLGIPMEDVFFPMEQWKALRKELDQRGSSFEFALCCGAKGLALVSLDVTNILSPVYVDFSDGNWKRRLFNISPKKELAAKALGLSAKQLNGQHYIFDANAGLGQDLFVFAALGARVQANERSSIVYELLANALERASQYADLQAVVERVMLREQDSITSMSQDDMEGVTAIYLDPMFPEKKHTALAKKEMQVFQTLVGADEDAEQLLALSLNHLFSPNSCSRVVLKRPRLAPVLQASHLSRQIMGNATRFDIYFAS